MLSQFRDKYTPLTFTKVSPCHTNHISFKGWSFIFY